MTSARDNRRTDGGGSIACKFAVHLPVQNVHHGHVIAGLDKTARERRPNESRPAGNEHGW